MDKQKLDEQNLEEQNLEEQKIAERREFLKKAGTIAVAAPAAVVLLSVASKRAGATAVSGFTQR